MFGFILSVLWPNSILASELGFFYDQKFTQICHAIPIDDQIAITSAHCVVQIDMLKLVMPIEPKLLDDVIYYDIESHAINPRFRTRLSEGMHDDTALLFIRDKFKSYAPTLALDACEIEIQGEFSHGDSGMGLFLDGKLAGVLSRKTERGAIFSTLQLH